MVPSGDAAAPESRFIVARSVSVIGRAKAGAERAVAPMRAAIRSGFFMDAKLVNPMGARKKITLPVAMLCLHKCNYFVYYIN